MEGEGTWTTPAKNGVHSSHNGAGPHPIPNSDHAAASGSHADSWAEPADFHAQAVRLRQAFLECVTDDDMRMIVRSLVWEARHGNVWAAREVFNRIAGKAHDPVEAAAGE